MLKIRAINFNLETLPKIHAEYPRTPKVYTEQSIAHTYNEGEWIFVSDPYHAGNVNRVITKEHFEEVYEMPASMISNDFRVIY